MSDWQKNLGKCSQLNLLLENTTFEKCQKIQKYGPEIVALSPLVRNRLHSVEDLISKIRSIVTHFKRSNNSSEKLMTYQKNSGVEPKKLIQDVATRWNSTYLMLDRFCELEEAVKATFALIEKDLPQITVEEWKICKELRVVIKPFYAVTTSVCGEKYASASLVIVLTNGLTDIFAKLMAKELCETTRAVVDQMELETLTRLGNVEQNNTLLVSTFLDPRFKTSFNNVTVSEKVRGMVVNLIASKVRKDCQDQETRLNCKPIKNPKTMMTFLHGLGWIKS